MNISPNSRIVLGAAALLFSGAAVAAEKNVPCATLPAVVQTAVQREAAGGIFKGCVIDKGVGKTTFEAETMKDGRSRDVTFSAAGEVLEVEQEVGREQLPVPVATAIGAATRGAKVNKIESLSRQGKIVSYEAAYTTANGKTHESAFTPEGKPKHGG